MARRDVEVFRPTGQIHLSSCGLISLGCRKIPIPAEEEEIPFLPTIEECRTTRTNERNGETDSLPDSFLMKLCGSDDPSPSEEDGSEAGSVDSVGSTLSAIDRAGAGLDLALDMMAVRYPRPRDMSEEEEFVSVVKEIQTNSLILSGAQIWHPDVRRHDLDLEEPRFTEVPFCPHKQTRDRVFGLYFRRDVKPEETSEYTGTVSPRALITLGRLAREMSVDRGLYPRARPRIERDDSLGRDTRNEGESSLFATRGSLRALVKHLVSAAISRGLLSLE
jgi:hypothetical protein